MPQKIFQKNYLEFTLKEYFFSQLVDFLVISVMLETNWVFLAGAAAPSAPALCTALRGNFFAVLSPRLKLLNPVKHLNLQELDKDLLYLNKALENKVPPELEDWRLPYLIDTCKGQVSSFMESASLISISSPANPPENSFYNGFSVNNGANSSVLVNSSVRFHSYRL